MPEQNVMDIFVVYYEPQGTLQLSKSPSYLLPYSMWNRWSLNIFCTYKKQVGLGLNLKTGQLSCCLILCKG